MKYFCDYCDSEIGKPTAVSSRPIATIEFIDTATGKSTNQMCCTNCAQKLKEYLETLKKDNGIITMGQDLNIKIK